MTLKNKVSTAFVISSKLKMNNLVAFNITCPNLKNNFPVFICWIVFRVNLKSPAAVSTSARTPVVADVVVAGFAWKLKKFKLDQVLSNYTQ